MHVSARLVHACRCRSRPRVHTRSWSITCIKCVLKFPSTCSASYGLPQGAAVCRVGLECERLSTYRNIKRFSNVCFMRSTHTSRPATRTYTHIHTHTQTTKTISAVFREFGRLRKHTWARIHFSHIHSTHMACVLAAPRWWSCFCVCVYSLAERRDNACSNRLLNNLFAFLRRTLNVWVCMCACVETSLNCVNVLACRVGLWSNAASSGPVQGTGDLSKSCKMLSGWQLKVSKCEYKSCKTMSGRVRWPWHRKISVIRMRAHARVWSWTYESLCPQFGRGAILDVCGGSLKWRIVCILLSARCVYVLSCDKRAIKTL